MLALASDHRNDILRGAAAVGIFLVGRGSSGWTGWWGPRRLIILRTGVEILRESSADLMDAVPGNELAEHL